MMSPAPPSNRRISATATHRPDHNDTMSPAPPSNRRISANMTHRPDHNDSLMPSSLQPSNRRISRQNTLLPPTMGQQLQQLDSAKVLRVVSRDDLQVITDSSIALGTGQARNMMTIGTIRYRPSKSQPPKEAKMENTYRLEPIVSFRPSRAEEIIRNTFKDIFGSVANYPDRPEEARHLVKMAANEIRNRTRMLNCDRYKIVVLVNIGQRAGQAVRVASRCLWSEGVDTWASVTVEMRNLFAVGTVFAVYTE